MCVANCSVAQSSYAIKRSADISDSVLHIKSCHLSRAEQQQVWHWFSINKFLDKFSTAAYSESA